MNLKNQLTRKVREKRHLLTELMLKDRCNICESQCLINSPGRTLFEGNAADTKSRKYLN